MELAENNQRLKNYLVDTFICGVFTIILFGVAVMIFNFDNKDAIFFDNYIYFFLLIRTIYYIVFEYYFLRTIGKTITKTKVQTIEGNLPGFQKILCRSLCRLIPFNAFSFLFGPGWHDRITATSVIKEG